MCGDARHAATLRTDTPSFPANSSWVISNASWRRAALRPVHCCTSSTIGSSAAFVGPAAAVLHVTACPAADHCMVLHGIFMAWLRVRAKTRSHEATVTL